jgi:hypothetical protein
MYHMIAINGCHYSYYQLHVKYCLAINCSYIHVCSTSGAWLSLVERNIKLLLSTVLYIQQAVYSSILMKFSLVLSA